MRHVADYTTRFQKINKLMEEELYSKAVNLKLAAFLFFSVKNKKNGYLKRAVEISYKLDKT